jgi:hypothetical protein
MSGGDTVAVTDDRWPSVGLVEHMIEVGRHPETEGQRVWPCWQVADALEAHSARHRLASQADALAVIEVARTANAANFDSEGEYWRGYDQACLDIHANLTAALAREGGV